MTSKKAILHIAIPTPLRRQFDYLSGDITHAWQPGSRVKVPFGRRHVIGVVVGSSETTTISAEKLKTVSALVDTTPLMDHTLLSLYHWASDYYQHPIGDVILGSLPKKIRDGVVHAPHVNDVVVDVEKKAPDFTLTTAQTIAIEKIQSTKHFQTFLLAGVTGSGKTEVYLRAIAHCIKQHKQALVLVPEISLTPQTVARFEARFHVPVLVLHSGLTDKKRSDAWMRATLDSPCIVIGTRSAVFAPLKNIGIIVIDEEHDTSFKQQSGFRYSARDVAVMRAKLSNIPIILGSATPSLESINNANEKKYTLLELPARANNTPSSHVILHGICSEKLNQGLSPVCIDRIREHLAKKNQVLLYLNRRGFAPVALCHQCGWSPICKHCDARMTVHEMNGKKLICHHCGAQSRWKNTCESCKQSELMLIGQGTEQLEKTISALFPDKKICRIDRDSVKTFKQLEKKLNAVHDHQVDILIGTQMIVKGHHFENVTLVAAIDVDNALFSGDFRATERLAQSLLQVAGRAGRAEKKGEVFIQTHHPEHPLLKILFEKSYAEFANTVLQERKLAALPPFVPMVAIRAESKQLEKVMTFLRAAKVTLTENFKTQISDPIPATMTRKAGVYRAFLFLQSHNRQTLNQALSVFVDWAARDRSRVRWMVDVDPLDFG